MNEILTSTEVMSILSNQMNLIKKASERDSEQHPEQLPALTESLCKVAETYFMYYTKF